VVESIGNESIDLLTGNKLWTGRACHEWPEARLFWTNGFQSSRGVAGRAASNPGRACVANG